MLDRLTSLSGRLQIRGPSTSHAALPRVGRLLAGSCLAVAGTLGFAPAKLLAQTTGKEVPQIEVAYTQILSADSLAIGQAAFSPDGRWVVFTNESGVEGSHLWMVSSEGGEPFPISWGPAYDDGPVWFPGGDRIAYRSDYPIVSLAIDPSTGKPVGNPQRITLEGSNAYFDVSPDGKWIAYTPRDENGNRVIRVVPSNGGIARTVAEENTSRPAWAPDGNSIYYVTVRRDPLLFSLMKIRVEGGARAEGATPDTVLMSNQFVMPVPGTAFLALARSEAETGVDLATLDGRRLAWLDLEKGMNPGALSRDGRRLLATRGESASPLRILPLAGGTATTLQQTDSRALAWTPDGDRVLLETALDGERLVFLASVSGGTMTQVRFPEKRADFGRAAVDFPLEHQPDPVLSADGGHLLYAVEGDAPESAILQILDMETGRASVLTTRYPTPRKSMAGRVLGSGGTVNRDDDEFFYWEKDGGTLVLKAASPLGGSRVLRAFDDPDATLSVSVFQDRLAYVQHSDGKASVILAEVGSEESRPMLTVDGFLDVLAWSPDGRWLAATNWPSEGGGARLMLVEVSASGEVEGEPRLVGPGAWSWWGHQWLPDSSGFMTAGTQGDVWFIPVDPAAEPIALSEEEEGEIGDFALSPDGRQIACAPRIPQGSSLWLVDLGDALVGKELR